MGRVKDENMDMIEAQRRDIRDMDEEANAFAMELLMPEKFLRADLANLKGFDIVGAVADDLDKNIAKLAKKYKVSTQMMVLRIGALTAAFPQRREEKI